MKTYRFQEPHCTGGCATVDITEEQIVKYMKEMITQHKNKNKYPKDVSNSRLIDEFVVIHWAWEVVSKEK